MAECKLAICRVFYISHIRDYVPLLVHLVISKETYRAGASQRKRGCCSSQFGGWKSKIGSLIWLWWGSTWLGHVLVDGSMLEAWAKGREHTLARKPERVSLLVQVKHTLCRWATPPALSFLCQPLLEDWGRAPDFREWCPRNLLTFTHCSKVGSLPLAPPPTWPVCCHHAPSWRENSIKGYVAVPFDTDSIW